MPENLNFEGSPFDNVPFLWHLLAATTFKVVEDLEDINSVEMHQGVSTEDDVKTEGDGIGN